MTSLRSLVERVITELTKLQAAPKPKNEKGEEAFPRLIDAGNGGALLVNKSIDHDISSVAEILMSNDQALALRYSVAEWTGAVRRAFGPALVRIDLAGDVASNADQVLSDVRDVLKRHTSAQGTREFAFGCSLFRNQDTKSFSIGPVRFELRQEWMLRKHSEGAISKTSRRRLEAAWTGQRLIDRKPSRDRLIETGILDASGDCPFICSVVTEGLGADAGLEKALVSARIATTAIALIWRTPSRALDGMNLLFDGRAHRQEMLSFSKDGMVSSGSSWSHMPHGPALATDAWEKALADYKDHFEIVGDVLSYVTNPLQATSRPMVMNTLAQSLLWFHEGCRETVTLMAIVKFSATLDALACGGKAAGICRLIGARLGIPDDQPIRAGGPPLRQAIAKIYNDGRSRTIHGTNDKLGYDWTATRGLAEQFCRLCLLASIKWAADNREKDDPLLLSQ